MLLSNPFRPDPRVLKEAESLSAQGYPVTVICWDRAAEYPPHETLPCGTRILRVQQVQSAYGIGAAQLWKLPLFWRAVLPYLAQIQPDLIHCHDFDTLPVGLWWGKPRGIPVVYDAHEYFAELTRPRLHGLLGSLIYYGIRASEQVSARLADAVVTVDQTLGEIYRRYHRRVIIIGHYPSPSLAARPTNAFQGNELNLLYAGRISTDRGMLDYLEILRGLRLRGIPARLILAGSFIPEQERAEFEQACHDLRDWITILGWTPYPEMPKVLRNADVGLAILQPIPRFKAALPVKLFEYMAAGLPVVASDFPLIREIVEKHHCGLLIDPSHGVKPAIDGIEEWWKHRETGIQAGERGRQAVLEHYNWDVLMQDLFALYDTLLSSR